MAKISEEIRKWCGICRDSCIDEDDCDALMQATCQMNAGQRKVNRNEAGTLVSFDDIPQILNQIACLACWQVLAGAHKPKKEAEHE